MDASALVFKALADPTRRGLLDELFARDGQTLVGLAGRFEMTRVGVAKHLRLLEESGLVVTRRQGREKRHYLNPVPIRLVHDRWVSKYTQPWAAGLVDLKRDLEDPVEDAVQDRPANGDSTTDTHLTKVYEIYIATTPERLWEAIIDPDTRAKYQFGAGIHSPWTRGSSYQVRHGEHLLIEGDNLEVDPPRFLQQSFHAIWDDDVAAMGTSYVSWEIEQVGDSCRLTVTHDGLPMDADPHLYGGWPMILSGLKTWLETGRELTTPGSNLYGGSR